MPKVDSIHDKNIVVAVMTATRVASYGGNRAEVDVSVIHAKALFEEGFSINHSSQEGFRTAMRVQHKRLQQEAIAFSQSSQLKTVQSAHHQKILDELFGD